MPLKNHCDPCSHATPIFCIVPATREILGRSSKTSLTAESSFARYLYIGVKKMGTTRGGTHSMKWVSSLKTLLTAWKFPIQPVEDFVLMSDHGQEGTTALSSTNMPSAVLNMSKSYGGTHTWMRGKLRLWKGQRRWCWLNHWSRMEWHSSSNKVTQTPRLLWFVTSCIEQIAPGWEG